MGWAFAVADKMLLETPAPCVVLSGLGPSSFTSHRASCWYASWKIMDGGLNTWVISAHVALSFWLLAMILPSCCGPGGVNQSMRALSYLKNLFIWKAEGKRQRSIFHPLTHSYWPQQLGLGQAEIRSRNSILVFYELSFVVSQVLYLGIELEAELQVFKLALRYDPK